MKMRMLVFLIVAAAGVTAALYAGSQKDPLAGAVCPVSGKAVVSTESISYKGGKLYFCCPGCADQFANNEETLAAKANQQLIATGQARQIACPLAGRPVNADQSLAVAGLQVGFCCPNCKTRVASQSGETQLDLVFGDKPFAKGFQVIAAKK